MDYLSRLENQSLYILREAFRQFARLAMLWSVGKDSTALLWLACKAFLGHVPFPLVHVDTTYKIPGMIEFRDRLVREIVEEVRATRTPERSGRAQDQERKMPLKSCVGMGICEP